MPRHRRRILFSYDADHGDCDPLYGCPSYPIATPSPSPSPGFPITSPPPWSYPPYSFPFAPDLAPSPSPVHDGAGGRRDQGKGGIPNYGPPAPGGPVANDNHRRFVTNVLIAAAALAFLSLILFGVSVAVRRRQIRRRRRQALLAPAPAATTNVGNDDPEGGGGGGGGVVHHVWYIRTVGLDEAAIDSISATRYRTGAGLLGAADCSVCLGEFSDGELVRLLPKCGHAFHVPCIDTWLRAHVNCPLCRSDVIDPAGATAIGLDADPAAADPDANANAAAEQVDAASDSTLEHEEDEEADDQERLRVEEDQHEQRLSSAEPLPQLPCPMPWNVRRAASMDAATVSTAADVGALDRLPEAAPEGEQSDREKDRIGADGHMTSTERLASGGPRRFFFSRHCRARSSVLPL